MKIATISQDQQCLNDIQKYLGAIQHATAIW